MDYLVSGVGKRKYIDPIFYIFLDMKLWSFFKMGHMLEFMAITVNWMQEALGTSLICIGVSFHTVQIKKNLNFYVTYSNK